MNKRFFIVFYTYTTKTNNGNGNSSIEVESGKMFNSVDFMNQIKKLNGFENVVITGFNELNEKDFEEYYKL